MRLEDRPDVRLYEVGRAPRIIDERDLGLPPGAPRLARLRSPRSRRILRLCPLKRLRCADLALGGVDLFHHTSRDLPPVARARQTVAVAEIPPPGTTGEAVLARALDRADGALVFSANTVKRLGQRFGFPAPKCFLVAVGCEHWRRGLGKLPERERVPRILALGPLRPGRRHLRLLKAFEGLVESGFQAHLHVVGAGGEEEEAFENVVAHSKVRLRIVRERSLPQDALAALVARSSVLVHLVQDSETPVTPLEAFSMGTPVVASRLPVHEEALGGLAELVENNRVDHASDVLAEAIERAIRSASDPVASAARLRQASLYSWERNARETVAAWRAICAGQDLTRPSPR